MGKSIKITDGLTYQVKNEEDEKNIEIDKIKPTQEWEKITIGTDKDGYEQFRNIYEVETDDGDITVEVTVTSTLDGMEIDDIEITKCPKEIEVIDNISCELEDEDDY